MTEEQTKNMAYTRRRGRMSKGMSVCLPNAVVLCRLPRPTGLSQIEKTGEESFGYNPLFKFRTHNFRSYLRNNGNNFLQSSAPSTKSEAKQDTMSDNDENEQSSESASLSSGTESNHTGGVSNASSISLARAETNAVNRSKIVVLAVIAIAAAACGAATYFFTKSEEEDDFHSQVRRD